MSSSITGESRLVTGLSEGTEYWFQVRARGDGETLVVEWGPYSNAVSARTPRTVQTPEGVLATALDTDSITVSWDSERGVRYYRLERALRAAGPWTGVSSTIPGSATSRTVNGLASNTRHHFRLSAYGDGDVFTQEWSDPSETESAYTHFHFTPGTVRPGGSSTNTWEVPAGVTGVYLEADFPTGSSREDSWGDILVILGKGLDPHSVGGESDSGLVSGASAGSLLNISVAGNFYDRSPGDVSLTFRLGSSTGPVLARGTARSVRPPPPPPTVVRAAADDRDSITVSWNSRTGVAKYHLERGTSGTGPWTTVDDDVTGTGSRISHSAGSLAPNTRHYFRVSAYGNGTAYAGAWGTPSGPVSAITYFDFMPRPIGPGRISTNTWEVPAGITRVHLVADFPTGSSREDSWGDIQLILGKGLPTLTVGGESDSGVLSGVSAGSLLNISMPADFYDRVPGTVTLTFRLGSPTGPVLATATARSSPPPPPPPTVVRAVADDSDSITVSWNSRTGVAKYHLERGTSGTGPWTTVDDEITGTDTRISHSAGSLAPNTRHYFRVSAYGNGTAYAGAWGTPSGPVSAYTHFDFMPRPIGPGRISTNTWEVPTGITGVHLAADFPTGSSREDSWGDIQLILGKGLPTLTVGGESDSGVLSGVSAGSLLNISVPADFYDRVPGTVTLTFRLGRATGPVLATATARSVSPVPPPPDGVEASPASTSSITVSWDELAGAARYQLQRGDSSTGPWTTVSSTITGESQAVTGLAEGTTYWFQVRARGDGTNLAAQWGPYSDAVSGRTLSRVTAPTEVETDPESISSITVSWDEVEGASRYQLQRASSSSGPWTTVSSFIGGESRLVIRLSEGTEYWFQVRARGDGETLVEEWGPYSTPVLGRTLSRVPAPEGVETDPESISSITVSWDEVEGASRYQLQRASSSTGPWITVSSSITGESRLVTGLSEGTEYWFQVRARGDGETLVEEWGPYSNAVSARTPRTVQTPEGVSAIALDTDSITVSWDSERGVRYYRLERALRETGPWTGVSSTIPGSATSRTVNGLASNTRHHFRLSAFGDGTTYAGAWGTPSGPVSAITRFDFMPMPILPGASSTNTWHVPPGVGPVYLAVDFPDGSDREEHWNDIEITVAFSSGTDKSSDTHEVAGESDSGILDTAGAGAQVRITVPDDFFDRAPGEITLTFHLGDSDGPVLAIGKARSRRPAFQFLPRPLDPGETSSNSWEVPDDVSGVYLKVDFSREVARDEAWGKIGILIDGTKEHEIGAKADGGELDDADSGSLVSLSVPENFFDVSEAEVTLEFRKDSLSGEILAVATVNSKAPLFRFTSSSLNSPMVPGDVSVVWDIPVGASRAVYLDVDFPDGTDREDEWGDLRVLTSLEGVSTGVTTVGEEGDSALLSSAVINSQVRVDVPEDFFDRTPGEVVLNFRFRNRSGPALATAAIRSEAQPATPLNGTVSVDQPGDSVTLAWTAGTQPSGANPDHFTVVVPGEQGAAPLYSGLENSDELQVVIDGAGDLGLSGNHTAEVRHCNAAGGCSEALRIPFYLAPPLLRISGLISSLDRKATDGFKVRATRLVTDKSYTIEISTSGHLSLGQLCPGQDRNLVIPSGGNSFSLELTVLGLCGGNGQHRGQADTERQRQGGSGNVGAGHGRTHGTTGPGPRRSSVVREQHRPDLGRHPRSGGSPGQVQTGPHGPQ